jgi:hypothetical protein
MLSAREQMLSARGILLVRVFVRQIQTRSDNVVMFDENEGLIFWTVYQRSPALTAAMSGLEWGIIIAIACFAIWYFLMRDDDGDVVVPVDPYKVYEKKGINVKHSNMYCKKLGLGRPECMARVRSACEARDGGCLGYGFTNVAYKGDPFGAIAAEPVLVDNLIPHSSWDAYIPQ